MFGETLQSTWPEPKVIANASAMSDWIEAGIDGFSLALAEDFSEVLNAEGRDYIQRVRGGASFADASGDCL